MGACHALLAALFTIALSLPSGAQTPGDILNQFANPDPDIRGLAFKGDALWAVDRDGGMFEIDADTGQLLDTLGVSAPDSYGLGYDSLRDLFLVTDDVFLRLVNAAGITVDSLPLPDVGLGGFQFGLGAAYDSTRDAYWVMVGDFDGQQLSENLFLLNPLTGAVLDTKPVEGCGFQTCRGAGAAYEACRDAVVYNCRDCAETYVIDAATGAELEVFDTPPSNSLNNGSGAAVRDAEGTVFVNNSDNAVVYNMAMGTPFTCFLPVDTETDLDTGETVVLEPGGEMGDPSEDAQVEITNTTGGLGETVEVFEAEEDLHPDAGGFGMIGLNLIVETTLDDGEFFMTVMIPFTAAQLGGADPGVVNLAYFNENSGQWELAASSNTVASPGHPGPLGDHSKVFGTSTPVPPVPSTDLGDYGVFWNTALQKGFVWANVDHATDFGPGTLGVVPYGCQVNPAQSLVQLDGTPSVGTTLTLGVDDPPGSSPRNAAGLILASLSPDPASPCGTLVGGWGMAGESGELLVNVLPPDPVAIFGPASWAGPGTPAAVAIPFPDDGSLVGLDIYVQGVMASAFTVKLAGASKLTLGGP